MKGTSPAVPAILLLMALNQIVKAQETMIQGLIYHKELPTAIADASVVNITSNHLTKTDVRGLFKIKVSLGDTIIVTKPGYEEAKRVIADAKDIVIYLNPIRMLEEVIVRGEKIEDQLNEIRDAHRAKGIYFNGKPPASLLSPFGGSPITFFHELLGKDGRRARAFADFAKREKEATDIEKRFNDQAIREILPIRDEELVEFKSVYRPTLQQLQNWDDVELYNYIRKSYGEFKRER